MAGLTVTAADLAVGKSNPRLVANLEVRVHCMPWRPLPMPRPAFRLYRLWAHGSRQREGLQPRLPSLPCWL